MIIFNDLLDCYEYNRNKNFEFHSILINNLSKNKYNDNIDKNYNYFDNDKPNSCSCGVHIIYKFIINNIETKQILLSVVSVLNGGLKKKR